MATTAPRRINSHLLALAESAGTLYHRSGTEQLEHWATLGAAVESVMSLPTVAKLKTRGRAANIDALIAKAGTPGGNQKLSQLLEKQTFPQYGTIPGKPGVIVEYSKARVKTRRRGDRPELKTASEAK
jgi:hypothetical protein